MTAHTHLIHACVTQWMAVGQLCEMRLHIEGWEDTEVARQHSKTEGKQQKYSAYA